MDIDIIYNQCIKIRKLFINIIILLIIHNSGIGDGKHPEEPRDRADDRGGLRHPAGRQPGVRAPGHPHPGEQGQEV